MNRSGAVETVCTLLLNIRIHLNVIMYYVSMPTIKVFAIGGRNDRRVAALRAIG